MKKPLEHLAIILDGNGRWAKKFNQPRTYGHQKGMEKIQDFCLFAQEENIKFLTVFAFSTENWNRPKDEVDFLMKVPSQIFGENKINFFMDNDIKVGWIGRQDKIPKETFEAIIEAKNKTRNNQGLHLTIAFDYGSWEEINTCFKNIISSNPKISENLELVTTDLIKANLYTNNLPDVDLVIRTGGETRLSNFMMLQCSYAEIYFNSKMWPDFSQKDLKKAISYYNKTNRRFGGLENEEQ
ncbi:polyprenyl diphosphate synthase [Spiroplasma alleghenense]|uniref:Isoprenyl transferase n=1 Tax=Spiroplasma alleghenense TaxID=216931 RepID=A0A345Z3U3_9MOLU|nr:polyprenyl diphosphate synthase [Spiroplasma alleghenense]AXK51272.1 undecaprenyl pyrophosphate synthase [Spiroplasma alleghenense]